MTSRLSTEIVPCTVVAFNGKIRNGLRIHEEKGNYLFSFGRTLAIKNITDDDKCSLLHNHRDEISCMHISNDGKYIATGQKTYMGFKTNVMVWEYATENLIGSHDLHKALVESVAFTSNDKYLISLGGDEFEKSVLVWSLELKEVLCGCQASQGIEGTAHTLASANVTANMFVSAGERTIRVWLLNEDNRQLTSDCVSTGHLKRDIRFLQIDKDDLYGYCGTTTGDILKIRLDLAKHKTPGWVPIYVCDLTKYIGPRVRVTDGYYSSGVTALCLTPKDNEIIVGTGKGMLYLTEQILTQKIDKVKKNKTVTDIKLTEKKEIKLNGAITSIIFHKPSSQIYVGTDNGDISKINYNTFDIKTLMTSHKNFITDISFPSSSSKIFVTSSMEEIHIWGVDPINDDKIVDIGKISVSRALCTSIHCMTNGRSIVSGWSDGKIRVFAPESRKLLYCISDSHRGTKSAKGEDISNEGVTAIVGTSDSNWIVSGGGDGQIRIWKASNVKQDLIANMKEHKGPVCCIRMHSSDEECVSASVDGTCIIWDLKRFARKQVVFASTIFKTVCYGLEECQLLTGGSDNNLSYWEVHNGELIRSVKAGARTESIQTLDLLSHGNRIVTGSSDGVLRVWLYHKGTLEFTGKGHGAAITKLKVAPDHQTIVSVGKDGSLIRWKIP